MPLLRVRERDVVRGLRDPDRLRRDPDPAAVERRHRDAEAVVAARRAADRPDDASIARSAVDDELSPSFSSSRVTVTWSASSMNAETPRAPASPDRCARTRERAGVRAVRDPLLRAGDASRPVRSARVTSAPASDPDPGSVSANAAEQLAPGERRHEPRPLLVGPEREQRQRRTADVWTATVTPTPASARDSSSSTRRTRRSRRPAPPYSSGTHTPISPSSASFAKTSRGKRCSRSQARRRAARSRPGELAGERLDLALLRRQLEVHAQVQSDVETLATQRTP
jgi:hypothetical protein